MVESIYALHLCSIVVSLVQLQRQDLSQPEHHGVRPSLCQLYRLERPLMTRSSLGNVAEGIIVRGPQKVEATPRRIRVLYGGKYIFDTVAAQAVWWVDLCSRAQTGS